eukprot:TRINITY_DN17291_c0_g1_i1.p1 TRINITY_DN17291_c0_g1~~TRINITY_DN17291_c0_g1_i1.p1  ORF type:complete len:470 (+),score=99.72 TRINITY_DN17291_c0_g1_i1:72-1481(+)
MAKQKKKVGGPSSQSDAGKSTNGAEKASGNKPSEAADMPEPSLTGEYGNIVLLNLLYTLQGVPMGLFGYVNMEVKSLFPGSFSEQGTFALAAWPFSLKLLWAPLVDSVYMEKCGRRKTWMVPAQLIIGAILLHLSANLEALFEAKDVTTMTLLFLTLYFLCATQDIAVDGWALTMLRPENAGWASTCNAVGQTLGFTIGFMVPMSKYVPISQFLLFWGTVFVATTFAVALLKHEKPVPEDEALESAAEAYGDMWKVCNNPSVRLVALHLFSRAVAFIPMDVIAPGRLQDAGFPKESLANIKLLVTPLELIMPWFLSKYTAGAYPLTVVLVCYIPRVLLTTAGAFCVFYFGAISEPTPMPEYLTVLGLTILQGGLSCAMFVAHMAFFAKISDPTIGGTYMTFLNTLHNLGNMWASTVCLKATDWATQLTGYDGFYVLSAFCTLYGFIWMLKFRPILNELQELPAASWSVH